MGDEDDKSWRTNLLAQKYIPTKAHRRAIVRASLAKPPKLLRRAAKVAANCAAAVLVATPGAGDGAWKMMAVLGGSVKARATSSRAERRRRDCDSEARTALERREV